MDLSTSVTIIGWFVQVVLDQGITYAIDHWAGGAAGDPELPGALESLRAAMNNVCAFLPLAQGNRSENRGVQQWFKELKAAAYDAEDLLSELDYYRLEKQVEGEDNSKSSTSGDSLIETTTGFFSNLLKTDDNQASTSSPLPSSRDNESIVGRIHEVVHRLEHIFTQLRRVLKLPNPENCRPIQHVFPEASHRTTTSFAPLKEKETWIGRVSEKDQIITSLLMPAAASVCVVPIVGMGGVGKTTLAKMVYNDEQIKNHFECRMWIFVSNDYDVARLTREMLECLGVVSDHIKNLNRLQELLMEKLQPVRFLIVLDDVWNEDEREKWGSLCAPLDSQKGGSRILMTTRLNTVVSIAAKNIYTLSPYPLEGLPEDQYLSLFNTYAFGDQNLSHHPSLVDIRKQIVRKLKGSPLAAKTVGGLLRQSLDEDHWRSVLNSPIWQLEQNNDDITPALQLSYQHLPPHLQQCFIYCSVFPKDRQFEKDEMVGMWISQGYVHAKSTRNKTLEEIGSEYFDSLLSRSFIQESSYRRYVLHDLLHDVAESVSENEYLKINLKWGKESTTGVRHLHFHSDDLSLLQSCDLRNLRTLIIQGRNESDDYSVLKEVLDGLESIRVLILNSVTEQLLSGSIGHLTHLRYLGVYCKKSGESLLSEEGASALPAATNSMVSLRPYHLQWLISGKDGLALPAAAKYLVSLRHFGSIMGSGVDMWNEITSLSWIGNLTCLQELERFSVEKSEGRKLAELKRLNELKGTLELCSLHNTSTKEEALEANLNKKEGIRALVLACGDGHATPHMAEEVFEGLCPPPCIKKLTLDTYLGVESPTWMMTVNCCLSVLQYLTLSNCLNWKVLPPLGQLPLLRHLWITNAYAVEEIGSSFYGSGVAKSFPSLETIHFRNMPEWVVWSGVEEDTDSLFPQLRELSVLWCPKLKGVPMQCLASVEVLKTNCMLLLGELENLASLKELVVENCEEMQSLPLLPASLVSLEISWCSQLSSLFTTQMETQTELPSLRQITIFGCNQLVSVELKSLPSLEKLKIRYCGTIQSVPILQATLAELVIGSCETLTAFSGKQEENLSDLTSLRKIEIYICPRFHSLPLMPASLQKLIIYKCPELPLEMYLEGGDYWHKISHVPDIYWV